MDNVFRLSVKIINFSTLLLSHAKAVMLLVHPVSQPPNALHASLPLSSVIALVLLVSQLQAS